jgi:uncharacterized membrane protein
MAKIGRRGRLWLRSFHILFVGLWIGVGIGELFVLFSAGNATDGSALNTYYAIDEVLNRVVKSSGLLAIITGVLLAWLTPWRFFKHKWVIYTIIIVILDFLIAGIWCVPAINKIAALAGAEGLSALQNPEYVSARNTAIISNIVPLLLLISAVFVSVMKPWRKRQEAEAAA